MMTSHRYRNPIIINCIWLKHVTYVTKLHYNTFATVTLSMQIHSALIASEYFGNAWSPQALWMYNTVTHSRFE